MRKSLIVAVVCGAFVLPSLAAAGGGKKADKKAIKSVIENAYVRGVHIDRNPSLMREGFHDKFIMFLNKDEGVAHMTIDEWAGRTKPAPADAPKPKVRGDVRVLDVQDTVAVARIKLFRDGKLVFTDFMSLYKVEGQWRIVGKVFHRHK